MQNPFKKIQCDYCGKPMSWLYRNFPPFILNNWYRVDIVEKDGSVVRSECACRECGEMLDILSQLTEEQVKAVLEIEKDEKNM